MLLGVSGLYVTVAGMLLWTPLTCTHAQQDARLISTADSCPSKSMIPTDPKTPKRHLHRGYISMPSSRDFLATSRENTFGVTEYACRSVAPTAMRSNLALGLPPSSENAPAGGRMSCRSTLYAELHAESPVA